MVRRYPVYPTYYVKQLKLKGGAWLEERMAFDWMDVIGSLTTADISKLLIAIDGGDPIPLNEALPAFIPFRLHVVRVYAPEDQNGRVLTLLVGGEYQGFRRSTEAVVLQSENIGLMNLLNDRLNATASKNLKISIEEARIKAPVDIQDHWAESVVLLPSAARTASGTGPDIDVGRFLYGEILLDVVAVSGTNPTLSVYIEGKNQYTSKYKTIFAQEGINAVGTYWYTVTMLAFRFLRVRWTIGGTSPSFTFSVSMEGKS